MIPEDSAASNRAVPPPAPSPSEVPSPAAAPDPDEEARAAARARREEEARLHEEAAIAAARAMDPAASGAVQDFFPQPLVNEFSWSKSREGTFNECKRRFWFQYYGSWGGWEPEADARSRDVYVLKQLRTRHIWIGNIVHEAIERSLKNMRASEKPLALNVDEIVDLTIQRMRSEWRSSRSGMYRLKPKSCALFEHEYKVDVPREEWKKAAETVERCLRNFYASDIYARLGEIPRADWLEIEDLSSFDIEGLKVVVVLDFSYRLGDEIVILDWKTGAYAEGDNKLQLSCYALYAGRRWGAPPERVRAIEFNLNRNEVIEHRLTPSDLEWTTRFISGSAADMRRLLRDSEKNIAAEEDFLRVNDPRVCLRCNFLRLCEPELPPDARDVNSLPY